MRYPYILIFFFLPFFILGQGGFRTRPMTPPGINSYSKFIFETSPGNYIAGGLISDTLNNAGVNSIVISGLNSTGQVLWTKKYRNEKLQYVYNSFITRTFLKQGNFLYHACGVLDSNGKYNGALLKFNLNGDTVWQKIYRDPDALEDVIPQMITTSVDGGFLMTGFFQNWSNNPYRKCLLIKTDANGNELWRRKIGKSTPNVQDGKAIVQDSASKKIVIVGYQYIGGTNSFENLLILDSLGNKISQNSYNNTGGILFDLIQTKDKKFVAVGQKIYPQTLGGYNLIKSFAVKFDVDSPSAPLWKIDGYDELSLTNNFSCIYELENGAMLIGGDLDTTHTKQLTDNYFHRLIKIDKNGNVVWKRLYDYSIDAGNTYYQSLASLTPGSNGSILASFQLYNASPNPFFFVKYDSTGCDSSTAYCATLNLVGFREDSKINYSIEIYPNPTKDYLNVRYSESYVTDEVNLSILDSRGVILKSLKLHSFESIDVRNLESGMYFITISQNNKIESKLKFIKE